MIKLGKTEIGEGENIDCQGITRHQFDLVKFLIFILDKVVKPGLFDDKERFAGFIREKIYASLARGDRCVIATDIHPDLAL